MDGAPAGLAGPGASAAPPGTGASCSGSAAIAAGARGCETDPAHAPEIARHDRADDLECALIARAIIARPPRAGQALPRGGVLWTAEGRRFDLSAAMVRGPLVLVFHRGGWSPWCVAALREYQLRLDDFREAGGTVLGVSPDAPAEAAATARRHGLDFELLSDPDDRFAESLGLGVIVPSLGHAIHALGADPPPSACNRGARRAALPATIVVGPDGRILLADADPDWRWRLDPQRAVDALRRPRTRATAGAGSTRADP